MQNHAEMPDDSGKDSKTASLDSEYRTAITDHVKLEDSYPVEIERLSAEYADQKRKLRKDHESATAVIRDSLADKKRQEERISPKALQDLEDAKETRIIRLSNKLKQTRENSRSILIEGDMALEEANLSLKKAGLDHLLPSAIHGTCLAKPKND